MLGRDRARGLGRWGIQMDEQGAGSAELLGRVERVRRVGRRTTWPRP